MQADELAKVETRLHALREELLQEKVETADGTAVVELDQARLGRLSRMDEMQQQAMMVELDRRRDIQLKRIEGAFIRLKKGAYGDCVRCGESIDAQRLEFDPTVFFCVGCAKVVEKR
jgi:DnaK suppressor protein